MKLSDVENKLKTVTRLSEDELNELRAIEKKHKNPFTKWADDREKKLTSTLKKMPKFLKRDF